MLFPFSSSLVPNGKEKLLPLVATVLVLQFIQCTKELKGIVFKTLMKLVDSSNWKIHLIEGAL